MLKPIDRSRRDGPLYPGSPKTLRDFIDPKHLLLRIDANFDFATMVAFLHEKYDPWIGRPAIHPEILIRAPILMAVYNIPSERQLCERIAENLAWRWFCYLTLGDPVFDHSTISVFRDRLGAESFQELLADLNAELLRRQLLSPRTYVDSTLVEANVRLGNQRSTTLPAGEFAQRVTEQDGTFVVREKVQGDPATGQPARLQVSRYQDRNGRLQLSAVDPDARWRRPRAHRPAILSYNENVIVDKSGFILARGVTSADTSDQEGAEALLDRLPFVPKSLAGDTHYGAGHFRQVVRRRGITLYAPLRETQEPTATTLLASGAFQFHGDHLICREDKVLYQTGFPAADGGVMFIASPGECVACPMREECLPPKQKRRQVGLSRYQGEFRRAKQLNETISYQREMRRRKTVVEGVFARLDRLGWDKARLRGKDKVDCQGSVAAIAHNILKALSKARFWRRAAGIQRSVMRPVRSIVLLVLLASRRLLAPRRLAPLS